MGGLVGHAQARPFPTPPPANKALYLFIIKITAIAVTCDDFWRLVRLRSFAKMSSSDDREAMSWEGVGRVSAAAKGTHTLIATPRAPVYALGFFLFCFLCFASFRNVT